MVGPGGGGGGGARRREADQLDVIADDLVVGIDARQPAKHATKPAAKPDRPRPHSRPSPLQRRYSELVSAAADGPVQRAVSHP